MGAISERLLATSIKIHGIGSERREAHGCFVARYVYQLFSSRDRPSGPGSFGGGRVSSGGPAVTPVLRAAALRFWDARPRKGISHPHHAIVGSRNRRGPADRSARAELRLRLSR